MFITAGSRPCASAEARGPSPRKASSHSLVAYAAVSSAPSIPAARTIQPAADVPPAPCPSPNAACSAAPSTASLEKKPLKGGRAASASSPTVIVQ